MDNNYMTVKEFAEAVGVSRQAVYRQVDKKLQGFTVKVDNQVMIDKVAITEVYHKRFTGKVEQIDKVDCKPSQPSKPVDRGENDIYRDAYIRLLERQLEQAEERARKLEEDRDRQIENLSTVIESMAAMNHQLQIENNQYKALVESVNDEAAVYEEEPVVEDEQVIESSEAVEPVEENHRDQNENKEGKKGFFSFLRRK